MTLLGPLHSYSTDVCGRSISSTPMVISIQHLTKPKEEICTVYIKIVDNLSKYCIPLRYPGINRDTMFFIISIDCDEAIKFS